MNFDGVEKIAAAILYEGYILYPYRPTAIKNRQRWNFGTLYPRIYAQEQRPPEASRLVAECLVVANSNAILDIKISFLQLVRQSVLTDDPEESMSKLADPSHGWEEAVERTSEHADLLLSNLTRFPLRLTLEMDATDLPESQRDDQATALQAVLMVSAEALQDGACKLHLELQNTSHLTTGAGAKREEALLQSFVSAHVLMGISDGKFVSQLDPAEKYRASTAGCCSLGVFPVLAGEEPERTMILFSPIILYDYPKVACESAGDFFDGTEMDEMLTLRVLTLTDAEKQEMRQGDPRARKILERTESLTQESLLKAHGVIRGLREIREDSQ